MTIKEPVLRELAMAKVIKNACLEGATGGYMITVWQGAELRTLISARGNPRLFTLDNAAKYLTALGVHRFEVDATSFVPGRIRKARPDRAAALKSIQAKHQLPFFDQEHD